MVKIGSLEYVILQSSNPIGSIDYFFNIFLKLNDLNKSNFIFFLSENTSIDEKFYPLFISKIFEKDKESLKKIKSNIIIQTHENFNSFYFEFINLLYLSGYDFNLFYNDFEHIYYEKTRQFVNMTLDYVRSINNIENF